MASSTGMKGAALDHPDLGGPYFIYNASAICSAFMTALHDGKRAVRAAPII